MLVIIGGTFDMDPARRDEFVAGQAAAVARSRAEDGCLRYDFGLDPDDPGRVILFEVWESPEALAAHQAAMRANPSAGVAATVKLLRYEVSSVSDLFPAQRPSR